MMQLNNQNMVKNDDHHTLMEALKEKEEEMLHMENLNTALTWKEPIANDELQDAREEAISVYVYLLSFLGLLQATDCKWRTILYNKD